MMYLDFYHLKDKPFQITCDPKFLWLSENHKEALAMLRYGVLDNRGFLLLSGEVGTGKTLLINHLLTQLSKNSIVAKLSDPDLNQSDFYRLLIDGFNLPEPFTCKAAFLIQFRAFLNQCAEDKKQVILIIDEAQRLGHQMIEDLRTLSNIEYADRKLINIFLVGQQELNQLLGREENRALAQRITIRYHIEPLDTDGTANYIRHRLEVAGCSERIFTDRAIEKISEYTAGVPRLINILCDHCLLTGCVSNAGLVDTNIVDQCADELSLPTRQDRMCNFRHARASNGTPPDVILKSSLASEKDAQAIPDTQLFNVETMDQKTSGRSYLKWIAVGVTPLVIIFLTLALINMKDKTPHKRYSVDLKNNFENKIAKTDAVNPSADIKTVHRPEPSPARAETRASSVVGVEDDNNRLRQQAAHDQSPAVAATTAQPRSDRHIDQTGLDNLMNLDRASRENVPISFDQTNQIMEPSLAAIDNVAEDLKKSPERIIYIRGYVMEADSAGDPKAVWRKRVYGVWGYLIRKGVAPHQIKLVEMNDNRERPPASLAQNHHAVIEIPQRDYAIRYNQDK